MIRGLLKTVPFMAFLLVPGLAKAAGCDWSKEVYKAKIGADCQAAYNANATNEQDKIYGARTFKNWQPVSKDTKVYTKGNLIQVQNEKEGFLFQMLWFSKSPGTAWINGHVVTDNSSDTSVSRRIQRMIAKANELESAKKKKTVWNFIFGDEAAARGNNNATAEAVATLYTVGEKVGTAKEILGDTASGDAVLAEMNDSLFRPLGLYKGINSIQCQDNGTIADQNFNINGRNVTIHQRSKKEFVMYDFPTQGRTMRVGMLTRTLLNGKRGFKQTSADLYECTCSDEVGNDVTCKGLDFDKRAKCSDSNAKKMVEAMDDADFGEDGNVDDSREIYLKSLQTRQAYRDALTAAGFTANEFCSEPPPVDSATLEFPKPEDFGPCVWKRNGGAELRKLYDATKNVKTDGDQAAAKGTGRKGDTVDSAALRSTISDRLMGMMILGDCCGDSTCNAQFENYHILLQGQKKPTAQ